MANNTYRLRYLPLFYTDLEEKIKYIADKLQNPQAANDLLAAVESAILERVDVADCWNLIIFSGLHQKKTQIISRVYA